MDEATRQKLLGFQRTEITEHHIYLRLLELEKDPHNREVLAQIADDEHRHYEIWKGYTGEEVAPNGWLLFKYYWIARLFGVTFGIKLMEKGEAGARHAYHLVADNVKEAEQMAREEEEHERTLIEAFDEELLAYTGSVVLGINDALVELTGALAGLTLALQNAKLIALTGSITGIAAAFSMAASEYLSTKAEGDNDKHPVKAAVYTGIAYLVTVILLIVPYILVPSLYGALAVTLAVAIGIIFCFNYYVSVAQDVPFRKRFLEMTILSLAVAAFSFGVGFVLRVAFNIEV